MNIEKTLETLRKLRSKYSSKHAKPEWYLNATPEEQERYRRVQKEYYDAIVVSIKAIKSVKTLETARNNIDTVLNTMLTDIDEGDNDE